MNPTSAEVIAALTANTRPVTPADIREAFGPDVDAAAFMVAARVLN